MQKLTRHNSCVDFSFMTDAASSNTRKLTRLNGLFHCLADRKTGGVRADKLHDLILKAGISELKCQRLEAFLFPRLKADNIEVYRKEKRLFGDTKKTKVCVRVISRGPFLAIFQDEPTQMVNSLMQAVVSSKKKSKKTVRWKIHSPKKSHVSPQSYFHNNNNGHSNDSHMNRNTLLSKDSTRPSRTEPVLTYVSHRNDDSIKNKDKLEPSPTMENQIIGSSFMSEHSSAESSPRSSAIDPTFPAQPTLSEGKNVKKKKKRSRRRTRNTKKVHQVYPSDTLGYRRSTQHRTSFHASDDDIYENEYTPPDYSDFPNDERKKSKNITKKSVKRQHRQCYSEGSNFLSMDMAGILMQDLEEQRELDLMQPEKQNDLCDFFGGFTSFMRKIGSPKQNVIF